MSFAKPLHRPIQARSRRSDATNIAKKWAPIPRDIRLTTIRIYTAFFRTQPENDKKWGGRVARCAVAVQCTLMYIAAGRRGARIFSLARAR